MIASINELTTTAGASTAGTRITVSIFDTLPKAIDGVSNAQTLFE